MPTKKATKKTPVKKVAAKKATKKAVKKTTKKAVRKTAKKTIKKTTKKTAAKTTVKKAVAPKTSTRKATTKKAPRSQIKKPLTLADDQRSFWVTNGQILNSLVALRDALDEMEKEVYSYHAGGAQNDFATWVEKVLTDNDCATELQKAKSPRAAKTVVVRHLKFYSV